jgi:hypothetical protein
MLQTEVVTECREGREERIENVQKNKKTTEINE